MLTREEKSQLRTLRSLQKKWNDALLLYDRFAQPAQLADIKRLEAEINTIPEHIRFFAAREDKLPEFVLLVERYILQRAARFLSDPADWKHTILTLHQNSEIPQTVKEVAAVVKGLADLQSIGASEDDIEISILMAGDLNTSRRQLVHYRLTLDRLAEAYLTLYAAFNEENGLHNPGATFDLAQAARTWKANIPDYRAHYDTWAALRGVNLSERVEVARFKIVSQIMCLHRLGYDDEKVDKILAKAQTDWIADSAKKK